MIEARDLVVGYGKTAILPPVSFRISGAEVWGLIGANGSGKSTLLKTLLGLIPAVSGRAIITDDVTIGYVPQRTSLDQEIPSRVYDIVEGGVDRSWSFLNPFFLRHSQETIARALRDTDTYDLQHQQFATLSEGQKQRVLIAKALVGDPTVLVLDEPTSAMDAANERAVFELLAELRRSRNLAVLIVSHHLPILGEFATHAVYVDRDEQVIVPGDIVDVCACKECKARYGDVFGARRPHVHDESCDHMEG